MTERISMHAKRQRLNRRKIDAALRRAVTYPHPAGRVRRIETHISMIYLAGRYAYKINKPVKLGFADFTQLATRRRSCNDEVRLNRRLAKRLYSGVVPIVQSGCITAPCKGEPVIGYAVRMRRFGDGCLYSDLLESGRLGNAAVECAADRLAAFHRSLSKHAPRHAFGSADLLQAQFDATLAELQKAGVTIPPAISRWCLAELSQLADHFDQRAREGFIRECHGDLHLDNIVQTGRDVLIFDCIGFSESMRWIDVMNDIAFLVMDLQARGRRDLACSFLNRWLSQTGDFEGLRALRFYMVYRALVRALVETLKAGEGSAERARAYLDFALEAARPACPELMLCHGFSGSGKSAASAALASFIDAIRLSSDTERKRRGRLEPASETPLPQRAYTPSSIDASYKALARLAHTVLQAGYCVIVDATFLRARHRRLFFELADTAAVRLHILDFHASAETLATRVQARSHLPHTLTDADLSVLVRQLANEDPLRREERALTLSFDTDVPLAAFSERDYWKPLFVLAGPSREHVLADAANAIAEVRTQNLERKVDLNQSACMPTS